MHSRPLDVIDAARSLFIEYREPYDYAAPPAALYEHIEDKTQHLYAHMA